MPKHHRISEEEVLEIEKARRLNKDKSIDNRLEVLLMRADMKSRSEIAAKTGFGCQYVTELLGKYSKGGLVMLMENHYGGNRRNLSVDEENNLLSEFEESARQGQIIETATIRNAYEQKVGHSIGGSQIYYVLKRHGWRKVMPRSKHPNKASEEDIEASKKLTFGWMK